MVKFQAKFYGKTLFAVNNILINTINLQILQLKNRIKYNNKQYNICFC